MASIIGVQELQHTNGTSAMTIDSSGRVLTPARPAFCVRWSTGQTAVSGTNWNRFNFDEEVFDTGNNVASAVFTTPVAGVYQFNLSQRFDAIGTGFIIIALMNHASTSESVSELFNTSYRISGSPSPAYEHLQSSMTIELPANYVVAPWYYNSADTSYNLIEAGAQFSGFLVG